MTSKSSRVDLINSVNQSFVDHFREKTMDFHGYVGYVGYDWAAWHDNLWLVGVFCHSSTALPGTARISTYNKGPTSTSHTSRFSSSKFVAECWRHLHSKMTGLTFLAWWSHDGVCCGVQYISMLFFGALRVKTSGVVEICEKAGSILSLLEKATNALALACGCRVPSEILDINKNGHVHHFPSISNKTKSNHLIDEILGNLDD